METLPPRGRLVIISIEISTISADCGHWIMNGGSLRERTGAKGRESEHCRGCIRTRSRRSRCRRCSSSRKMFFTRWWIQRIISSTTNALRPPSHRGSLEKEKRSCYWKVLQKMWPAAVNWSTKDSFFGRLQIPSSSICGHMSI